MGNGWKRHAVANTALSFDAKPAAEPPISDKEVEKLHARIGQLVVERDFWRMPPVSSSAPEAKSEDTRAQGLRVPSQEPGDHPAQPGLVRRHPVHPHAPRISLPGGRLGLAPPQGAERAAVDQFGMRPPSPSSLEPMARHWQLRGPCRTDAGFCAETPNAALEKYGPPGTCDSDRGSQFTSADFTDVPQDAGVRISMDGRGRWIDDASASMRAGPGRPLERASAHGSAITMKPSSHGLPTPAEAHAIREPDLKPAA